MVEALFLDRDGIINEIVMRGNIVGSPRHLNELIIREEFPTFYHQVIDLKIPVFVVSNQPDISRKLMTQEDLDAMTNFITKKFFFLQFFYCVHDDSDLCFCRKPKSGLITSLLNKYKFVPENCYLIGDSHKDIEAGTGAGVKTVLMRTRYNQSQICYPDYKVNTLDEFFFLIK